MPGAIFVFDYPLWAGLYPELAGSVTSGMATNYFGMATTLLDNTGTQPWSSDPTQLATLFNLLVAHVAALLAPIGGNPSSPLVGRISNASEGSVSVAVDLPTRQDELDAYYAQTKYGAMFWAMTARYRRARYYPSLFQPFRQLGGRYWGI